MPAPRSEPAGPFASLAEFVAALDAAGELRRIAAPVSPLLEITEIADRVSKINAPHEPSAAARTNDPAGHARGGPALLFENVLDHAGRRSAFPVLINAYGSYRRMELALGCAGEHAGFDAIGHRIGELVKPQPPRSLREAIAKAKQFAPLLRIAPRSVTRAPCQQVVITGDAVDLTTLPIIRCWPLDGDFAAVGYPADVNEHLYRPVDGRPAELGHPGLSRELWDAHYRGRYITLAGIHTVHADDRDAAKPSSHNIGMYRVQLLGKNRLAMHWHMHHDGASHWRSWKKLGRPMPVAIALGGESIMPYAATCPLPPGISELLMAGFLNGRGIPLTRCKTVPLRVPANAEIVIEGFVRHDAGLIGYDPREPGSGPIGPGAVFEGPFGDHTGFYSMPDRYPILEVTAITHRRNAIYPTTVVGLPPQEDYYLGKATERIMLPLLKTLIPDIADYDLPEFGTFHNCAFIKIRKHYPLHARKVMHAVWGAGQMAWTKSIFVVDHDVNVHSVREVLAACAAHCRPDRDIERVNGPLDILDHAAPRLGGGTKIGFDCTRKIPGEEVGGIAIDRSEPPADADAPSTPALLAALCRLPGVLDAGVNADGPGWLFVRADRGHDEPARAGLGRTVAQAVVDALSEPLAARAPTPRLAVVLGREVDITSTNTAMFHWLANADPGRDAVVRTSSGQPLPCIVFDATPKTLGEPAAEPVRAWPPILSMSDAVRERVTQRWRELGLPES